MSEWVLEVKNLTKMIKKKKDYRGYFVSSGARRSIWFSWAKRGGENDDDSDARWAD